MRYLAALVVGLIGLTLTVTPVSAQNTNSNGTVVYTLELSDTDIDDLKNGQSLVSKIPDHLLGKVSSVNLRYVPDAIDSTAQNPYGSSTSPIAPRTTPDFSPGTTGSSGGSMPAFRPGGTTGGTDPGTSIPRFNPGSSSNDSWRNDGNDRLIPPTPRGGISQSDSRLGPPNPYASDAYGDAYRDTYRDTHGHDRPNTNPSSTFRSNQTQPASTQPTDNYYPPERERSDFQMRPAAPSNSEFDTAQRRRQLNDPIRRSEYDYARQQPPSQYSPPSQQRYPEQQTYAQQPPVNRIASRDMQNNYIQPTRPQNDYPTDADLANRGAPWSPTMGGYGNNEMPPRGSLVAGHDSVMIPNQAPRIAASNGAPSWNGAQGSGETLTMQIPANQSSQNNPESVGVNRGPNGQLPVSQLNKFNNFLYFLLLCSIGLNIYLAWISRGFYVRYRELADELRDTFSSAV